MENLDFETCKAEDLAREKAEWQRYTESRIDDRQRRRLFLMGEVVSFEELARPRIRVQSIAFTRSIDGTITHPVRGEFYEVPVQSAKLVVWLETEMQHDELSWRWMGAVYSWKNCSMMPLDFCNELTQSVINRYVTPLAREWAHIVRRMRIISDPEGGPSLGNDMDV